MLSKKTKARIKRNKQRRIQCRTKDGRDLIRLIKESKRRSVNRAVKTLLQLAEQIEHYTVPPIGSNRDIFFPCSTDEDSTNPNNCLTCGHIQNPGDGHCYMFRNAPTEVCMQHTGRRAFGGPLGISRFL